MLVRVALRAVAVRVGVRSVVKKGTMSVNGARSDTSAVFIASLDKKEESYKFFHLHFNSSNKIADVHLDLKQWKESENLTNLIANITVPVSVD